MSQRVDERVKTKENLDAYTKVLELTKYSMEVCKPKTKKNSDGTTRESNHHIPARYSALGTRVIDTLLDMGGKILEANELYINKSLDIAERKKNLVKRLEYEKDVISKTYYIEHIVRVLNDHRKFADSTFTYWVKLIVESRRVLIAWRDSDKKALKGCEL